MRPRKKKTEETGKRIVCTAARLFVEHGIDGVSVSKIMQEVGLTHGGFYRRYHSKDHLVCVAVEHLSEQGNGEWFGIVKQSREPLKQIAEMTLALDRIIQGESLSALSALAPDLARKSGDLRNTFEKAVLDFINTLQLALSQQGTAPERGMALFLLSAMIGATTLARAVGNELLAKELLSEVQRRVCACQRSPGNVDEQ